MAVTITPNTVTVLVNSAQTFVGAGGTGPYTYSLISGVGSINPTTGVYQSGASSGSASVSVVDSLSATATATVTVSAPNTAFTLAQLITTVRERGDYVNSQFVTDAEITTYINQSYAELYDILIQAFGNDYFVAAPYVFQTTGTTQQQYPLPSNLYKLIGVDLQVSASPASWVTLRKFEFTERNKYWLANQYAYYGITNLRYRLVGGNLWLTPVPAQNQSLQLWYIPRVSYLVNSTDVVDGVSGWEEYIIVDAVMKCRIKEETEIQELMAQKQALLVRITNAAENRDASEPSRVSDTQSVDQGWPGSGE